MTSPTYVPLDSTQHKHYSIVQDNSYSHAKDFNLVNVGFNEIASLSGCMPLAVAVDDTEHPHALVAVVGWPQFGNVFCGQQEWLGHALPLSIQSYPFNYALGEQKFTVLLDESAPCVSPDTSVGVALFSTDGQPSSLLKAQQSALSSLVAGQQQAQAFLKVLRELGLLTRLSVSITRQDGEVHEAANLLSINEEKLAELNADTLLQLHQQGILMAINAMMLSLRQYNRLVQLTRTNENPIEKVGLKLISE
ncbi:hypothetical protein GTH32_04035 [Alteromonas sp. 345S023]|uniref:SapC family protein n=1 Tax=Alteromonas profundi TaxID=2696062 RepID=A0A7X5LJZ0_9ALTE|nr:SapC family protein [Alteromonas profundi]NDV90364.1 hypothetical protein [Alteromonas profundi]